MKIAVVGSRNYTHLMGELVKQFIHSLPKETEVVSGGAPGVDSLAIGWARYLGLHTTVFRASWHIYGHSAGIRRNIEIVNYADQVVAFWDGSSRGTKHTVDYAKKTKKLVTVFYPDGSKEFFNQYVKGDEA